MQKTRVRALDEFSQKRYVDANGIPDAVMKKPSFCYRGDFGGERYGVGSEPVH